MSAFLSKAEKGRGLCWGGSGYSSYFFCKFFLFSGHVPTLDLPSRIVPVFSRMAAWTLFAGTRGVHFEKRKHFAEMNDPCACEECPGRPSASQPGRCVKGGQGWGRTTEWRHLADPVAGAAAATPTESSALFALERNADTGCISSRRGSMLRHLPGKVGRRVPRATQPQRDAGELRPARLSGPPPGPATGEPLPSGIHSAAISQFPRLRIGKQEPPVKKLPSFKKQRIFLSARLILAAAEPRNELSHVCASRGLRVAVQCRPLRRPKRLLSPLDAQHSAVRLHRGSGFRAALRPAQIRAAPGLQNFNGMLFFPVEHNLSGSIQHEEDIRLGSERKSKGS